MAFFENDFVGHFDILTGGMVLCLDVEVRGRLLLPPSHAERNYLLLPQTGSPPSVYDSLIFFWLQFHRYCNELLYGGGVLSEHKCSAAPRRSRLPLFKNLSVSGSDLTCFLFLLFSFLPLPVSVSLSHCSPFTLFHSISNPTPFLLLLCSLCLKMVSMMGV